MRRSFYPTAIRRRRRVREGLVDGRGGLEVRGSCRRKGELQREKGGLYGEGKSCRGKRELQRDRGSCREKKAVVEVRRELQKEGWSFRAGLGFVEGGKGGGGRGGCRGKEGA